MGNNQGKVSFGRYKDKQRPDTRAQNWSFHSMSGGRCFGTEARSSAVSTALDGGNKNGGSIKEGKNQIRDTEHHESVSNNAVVSYHRDGGVRIMTASGDDMKCDVALSERSNAAGALANCRSTNSTYSQNSSISELTSKNNDSFSENKSISEPNHERKFSVFGNPWVKRLDKYRIAKVNSRCDIRKKAITRKESFKGALQDSNTICKVQTREHGSFQIEILDSSPKRRIRNIKNYKKCDNKHTMITGVETGDVINKEIINIDNNADSSHELQEIDVSRKTLEAELNQECIRISLSVPQSETEHDAFIPISQEITHSPRYLRSNQSDIPSTSPRISISIERPARVSPFVISKTTSREILWNNNKLSEDEIENAMLSRKNLLLIDNNAEEDDVKDHFRTHLINDLSPISSTVSLSSSSTPALSSVTDSKFRNMTCSSLEHSENLHSEILNQPLQQVQVLTVPSAKESNSSAIATDINEEYTFSRGAFNDHLAISNAEFSSHEELDNDQTALVSDGKSQLCFCQGIDKFYAENIGSQDFHKQRTCLKKQTRSSSKNHTAISGEENIEEQTEKVKTWNIHSLHCLYEPCRTNACGSLNNKKDELNGAVKETEQLCKKSQRLNLPLMPNYFPGHCVSTSLSVSERSRNCDLNASLTAPNLATTPTSTDSGYNTVKSFASCEQTAKSSSVCYSRIPDINYGNRRYYDGMESSFGNCTSFESNKINNESNECESNDCSTDNNSCCDNNTENSYGYSNHRDTSSFCDSNIDNISFCESNIEISSFCDSSKLVDNSSFCDSSINNSSGYDSHRDTSSFCDSNLNNNSFCDSNIDNSASYGSHRDKSAFCDSSKLADKCSGYGSNIENSYFCYSRIDNSVSYDSHMDNSFFCDNNTDNSSYCNRVCYNSNKDLNSVSKNNLCSDYDSRRDCCHDYDSHGNSCPNIESRGCKKGELVVTDNGLNYVRNVDKGRRNEDANHTQTVRQASNTVKEITTSTADMSPFVIALNASAKEISRSVDDLSPGFLGISSYKSDIFTPNATKRDQLNYTCRVGSSANTRENCVAGESEKCTKSICSQDGCINGRNKGISDGSTSVEVGNVSMQISCVTQALAGFGAETIFSTPENSTNWDAFSSVPCEETCLQKVSFVKETKESDGKNTFCNLEKIANVALENSDLSVHERLHATYGLLHKSNQCLRSCVHSSEASKNIACAAMLCTKDNVLYSQDNVLGNKNNVICNKDDVIYNKNDVICNKDDVICNKDNVTDNQDDVLDGHDNISKKLLSSSFFEITNPATKSDNVEKNADSGLGIREVPQSVSVENRSREFYVSNTSPTRDPQQKRQEKSWSSTKNNKLNRNFESCNSCMGNFSRNRTTDSLSGSLSPSESVFQNLLYNEFNCTLDEDVKSEVIFSSEVSSKISHIKSQSERTVLTESCLNSLEETRSYTSALLKQTPSGINLLLSDTTKNHTDERCTNTSVEMLNSSSGSYSSIYELRDSADETVDMEMADRKNADAECGMKARGRIAMGMASARLRRSHANLFKDTLLEQQTQDIYAEVMKPSKLSAGVSDVSFTPTHQKCFIDKQATSVTPPIFPQEQGQNILTRRDHTSVIPSIYISGATSGEDSIRSENQKRTQHFESSPHKEVAVSFSKLRHDVQLTTSSAIYQSPKKLSKSIGILEEGRENTINAWSNSHSKYTHVDDMSSAQIFNIPRKRHSLNNDQRYFLETTDILHSSYTKRHQEQLSVVSDNVRFEPSICSSFENLTFSNQGVKQIPSAIKLLHKFGHSPSSVSTSSTSLSPFPEEYDDQNSLRFDSNIPSSHGLSYNCQLPANHKELLCSPIPKIVTPLNRVQYTKLGNLRSHSVQNIPSQDHRYQLRSCPSMAGSASRIYQPSLQLGYNVNAEKDHKRHNKQRAVCMNQGTDPHIVSEMSCDANFVSGLRTSAAVHLAESSEKTSKYRVTSLLDGYTNAGLSYKEKDPVRNSLSQDVCPGCHQPFDNGRKRKLIDSCGHGRCYTCVFKSLTCPTCVTPGSDSSSPPSPGMAQKDLMVRLGLYLSDQPIPSGVKGVSMDHSRKPAPTNSTFT